MLSARPVLQCNLSRIQASALVCSTAGRAQVLLTHGMHAIAPGLGEMHIQFALVALENAARKDDTVVVPKSCCSSRPERCC